MSETAREQAYAEGYADGRRDVAAMFTWEDVDLLREDAIVGRVVTDGPDPDFWDLADRIASLLPPMEPNP